MDRSAEIGNTPQVADDADSALGLRPLTARSVLVSMLLGTHPPRLPVRVLIAATDLFGISQGAARTALSRMVAAGEVVGDNGWYELRGGLVDRQQGQDVGRTATRHQWDGSWRVLIAPAAGRSASERVADRSALGEARYAQLRDGLWARPDNLDLGPGTVDLPGEAWVGAALRFDQEPSVTDLWPVDEWQRQADGLRAVLASLAPAVERGEQAVLARGFVVAAGVLRLFRSDPLLPDELLPDGWPGTELRTEYDRFDAAYRRLLEAFFAHVAPPTAKPG